MPRCGCGWGNNCRSGHARRFRFKARYGQRGVGTWKAPAGSGPERSFSFLIGGLLMVQLPVCVSPTSDIGRVANRPQILVLSLLVIVGSSGCASQPSKLIDNNLNPWLGKTKDERIRLIGAPSQCVALSNGDEACSWIMTDAETQTDCPPDFVHGGHRCSGSGSSGEHHVVMVYDRNGIAQEWNYRGSLGERSSKDSKAASNSR